MLRHLMEAPDRLLDRMSLRRAPGLPTQLHMAVTDRCFLPCTHCDIWKNKTSDLAEADWRRTIQRLGQWCAPASMNFVGGEPLMFKGLTNLMQLAVELGFTVSFNTNGWLVNQSNAKAFCEAGVSIAYVSLDGASEHTVDVTRGKAGSFDKAIQAIEHFEHLPNPRVVVATVLHAKNALEIPALLQFVKERGLQVVVQPLYQNFGENTYEPDWFKRSELWPQDQSELTPIFEALDLLSTERFRGGPVCNTVSQLQAMKTHFAHPESTNGVSCRAGHSDLSFDARGNIRLCYFLEPVGNIFDSTPLPMLWDHPRALRRRHQVSRCERHCNLLNCNFEANGKQPIRHAKEHR